MQYKFLYINWRQLLPNMDFLQQGTGKQWLLKEEIQRDPVCSDKEQKMAPCAIYRVGPSGGSVR